MTDAEQGDSVEFYTDPSGEHRWRLRAAGNHEVIAASTEGYEDKRSARENYERVTGRQAPDDWQESLG